MRLITSALVGLAAAASLALTPVAHADGQDDAFLSALSTAGIPAHDGIPAVIAHGHNVCDALGAGMSPGEAASELAQHGYAEDPSHPFDQYLRTMTAFVRISVQTYCPGHGVAYHGKYHIRLVSQDDDAFLAGLAAAGIPARDGIPALVESGHRVCKNLGGGASVSSEVDRLVEFAHNADPSADLGRIQRTFAVFVQVAIQTYCPGRGQAGFGGRLHVRLAGVNGPDPVLPPVPDADRLSPPVAPAPAPKRTPVVAPPASGPGRDGGGNDGGSGPQQPAPADPGPGHVTLLP